MSEIPIANFPNIPRCRLSYDSLGHISTFVPDFHTFQSLLLLNHESRSFLLSEWASQCNIPFQRWTEGLRTRSDSDSDSDGSEDEEEDEDEDRCVSVVAVPEILPESMSFVSQLRIRLRENLPWERFVRKLDGVKRLSVVSELEVFPAFPWILDTIPLSARVNHLVELELEDTFLVENLQEEQSVSLEANAVIREFESLPVLRKLKLRGHGFGYRAAMLRFPPTLRELDLEDVNDLLGMCDHSNSDSSFRFERLEKFRLESHRGLPHKVLDSLCKMHGLRTLSICSVVGTQFDWNCLQNLRNFRHIRSLDLRGLTQEYRNDRRYVTVLPTSLRDLSLYSCGILLDRKSGSQFPPSLERLSVIDETLTRLFFYFDDFFELLPSEHLRSLRMSEPHGSVWPFLARFKELEELELLGFSTAEIVPSIEDLVFPSVHALVLRNCGRRGLSWFLSRCPEIRTLEFRHSCSMINEDAFRSCRHLTSASIRLSTYRLSSLSFLRAGNLLKTLSLRNYNYIAEPETEEALCVTGWNLERLERLHLTNFPSWLRFFPLGSMNSLRYLACDSSDPSMSELQRLPSSLEELKICEYTDYYSAVKEFRFDHLPRLEVVYLRIPILNFFSGSSIKILRVEACDLCSVEFDHVESLNVIRFCGCEIDDSERIMEFFRGRDLLVVS